MILILTLNDTWEEQIIIDLEVNGFLDGGTLFAWRIGEEAKALVDMCVLTPKEVLEMEKVWKVLKIHNLNYCDTHMFWND